MLAVEADYADREARLQEKIDNIESSHPCLLYTSEDDIIMAIWSCVGYTVLLCFTLFKTGSLAKSVIQNPPLVRLKD